MKERIQFWTFDPSVLQHVRFDEFSWLEVVLIVVGLSALGLYFLFAIVLDQYARHRAKLRAQEARLMGWLKDMALPPESLTALKALAGGPQWHALFKLLSDPYRLETRLHQALEGQLRGTLPQGISAAVLNNAVSRVRQVLRYYSSNTRFPLVSTRQFLSGDTLHLLLSPSAVPEHRKGNTEKEGSCYAWVAEQASNGLILQFPPEDFQAIYAHKGKVSFTFLRDLELEYAFPWRPIGADQVRHRYLVAHGLTLGLSKPRQIRLPFGQPILFQARIPHNAEVLNGDKPRPHAVSADTAKAGPQREGTLLDLSEGGFAIVSTHREAEGALIGFPLTLGGKHTVQISGRVLTCLPFREGQALMRCETRGLTPAQANQLGLLLRQELARRLAERKRNLKQTDKPEPQSLKRPSGGSKNGQSST